MMLLRYGPNGASSGGELARVEVGEEVEGAFETVVSYGHVGAALCVLVLGKLVQL